MGNKSTTNYFFLFLFCGDGPRALYVLGKYSTIESLCSHLWTIPKLISVTQSLQRYSRLRALSGQGL